MTDQEKKELRIKMYEANDLTNSAYERVRKADEEVTAVEEKIRTAEEELDQAKLSLIHLKDDYFGKLKTFKDLFQQMQDNGVLL